MVLHSIILATSLALPAAGTHWHGAGYPVESGRPAQGAHATRHRATQPRRSSGWYLLYRAQHRRLLPAVVPVQPHILHPGLLLHATGESTGHWVRAYVPGGRSWIYRTNLRPASEPAWYQRLQVRIRAHIVPHASGAIVIRLHPSLRHVRTVSHLPSPLPVANAAPVTSTGAAAATPQPVVVQQQVVVQPAVLQPAPVGRTPIQSIYFWAGQYGVNGDLLLRTAECESGLNAAAYNPSGASGGLQFMPSTFAAYSSQLQWDHTPSYWNFDDSARVAAYMWSQGQQGQWSCWYVTTQGYNPDNG